VIQRVQSGVMGGMYAIARMADERARETARQFVSVSAEAGTREVSPHARNILAVAERHDRAAFAALFTHFAPRVKGYLIRHGAAPEAAEDLAQETLLIVWRKAASFDPAKADAPTWIFTIARNLRISAVRRERRPEPMACDELGRADPGLPADEAIAVTDRTAALRAALESLPPEQARIVELNFLEDVPHRELETRLGIPLGTVKSRLRLAIVRLRAALGDQE
jgi:RNA polymerase sigma-70 factor, ECF subfamily